jgi:hypothetical protein
MRIDQEAWMFKYALTVVFIAAVSTECLAAEEFYVFQDSETKKCKIATERPDGVKKIMIGTSSYTTREQAKAAKHAAPECKILDGSREIALPLEQQALL